MVDIIESSSSSLKNDFFGARNLLHLVENGTLAKAKMLDLTSWEHNLFEKIYGVNAFEDRKACI